LLLPGILAGAASDRSRWAFIGCGDGNGHHKGHEEHEDGILKFSPSSVSLSDSFVIFVPSW
jgi:hypothetical protein